MQLGRWESTPLGPSLLDTQLLGFCWARKMLCKMLSTCLAPSTSSPLLFPFSFCSYSFFFFSSLAVASARSMAAQWPKQIHEPAIVIAIARSHSAQAQRRRRREREREEAWEREATHLPRLLLLLLLLLTVKLAVHLLRCPFLPCILPSCSFPPMLFCSPSLLLPSSPCCLLSPRALALRAAVAVAAIFPHRYINFSAK